MQNIHYSHLSLQGALQSHSIKKIVIYIFVFGSLLATFNNIHKGNDEISSQLILKNVLPYFNNTIEDTFFLKRYVYECTNIMIGQPLTLITHTMPYLTEYNNLIDITNHDITGYFDKKNLAENFIDKDGNSYSPKLPTLKKMDLSEANYKDTYYILKNFVSGDGELGIDTDLLKKWDFYQLMTQKLRIKDNVEGPKILIFHTHARELYKDGKSVVDAGEKLKQVFEKEYGIETMHVTSEFYADDTGSVNGCYEIMEKSIKEILKQNPSIEICIDIHRDGVNGESRLTTSINNKQLARIMFVNGLCMNRNIEGQIVQKEELINPYLNDNLAFSFQAQAMAYKYYPGLTKKVYFKEYRYSLHMKPMSLLVEIGNQNNIGEEVFNAIEPLGDIIAKVIAKD